MTFQLLTRGQNVLSLVNLRSVFNRPRHHLPVLSLLRWVESIAEEQRNSQIQSTVHERWGKSRAGPQQAEERNPTGPVAVGVRTAGSKG